MAMTVANIRQSLRLVPQTALMAARIPDGPGSRSEKLALVGHHNRDAGDIDNEQPVEIFTDPEGGRDVKDMTAAQLSETLAKFPETSLVRVAVLMPKEGADDPGHHRILDIETIGFGTENAAGSDMPPVELQCERWDNLSIVIRRNDHKVGQPLGDMRYDREATVDANGERVETGPVRMRVAGEEAPTTPPAA
jgi:hypothetical protein